MSSDDSGYKSLNRATAPAKTSKPLTSSNDPYRFVRSSNPKANILKQTAQQQLDMSVSNKKRLAATSATATAPSQVDFTSWNDDLEKWKNKRRLKSTKSEPIPIEEVVEKVVEKPKIIDRKEIKQEKSLIKNWKQTLTINLEIDPNTQSFGIEIGFKQNSIGANNYYVCRVDEQSPAEKANVRVGDDIKEIDGMYVKTMSKPEVMKLMSECRQKGSVSIVLVRTKTQSEVRSTSDDGKIELIEKKVDFRGGEQEKKMQFPEQRGSIDFSSYSVSSIRKKIEQETTKPLSPQTPRTKITKTYMGGPVPPPSLDDDSTEADVESFADAPSTCTELKITRINDKTNSKPKAEEAKTHDSDVRTEESTDNSNRAVAGDSDDATVYDNDRSQSSDGKMNFNENITSPLNKPSPEFVPRRSADSVFVSPVVHRSPRVSNLRTAFEQQSSPSLNVRFDASRVSSAHPGDSTKMDRGMERMKRELRSSAFRQPSVVDVNHRQEIRTGNVGSPCQQDENYESSSLNKSGGGVFLDPTNKRNSAVTTIPLERTKSSFVKELPMQPLTRRLTEAPERTVDKHELCANCGRQLESGRAMVIPELRLCFHLECFRCCTCSVELPIFAEEMDVLVKDRRLACRKCFVQRY